MPRVTDEPGLGDQGRHGAQRRLCVTADILTPAGFPTEPDTGPAGEPVPVVHDERAPQHPDDIATRVVRAGYPPTRLVVQREDLESYFLRLVGAAAPTEA